MINTEQMHQRRMKIMYMHAIRLNVIAVVICYAMGVPWLYSAARHPCGKTTGMMIATKVRLSHLPLTIVGAAKLTAPDDERVVQHSSRSLIKAAEARSVCFEFPLTLPGHPLCASQPV